MRASQRRPLARKIAVSVGPNLGTLAARVRYVGSPEHKDTPSFAGHPRPRADASICDRRFLSMQPTLTQWLQDAIRKGAVGSQIEGDFPRYVWYKEDDVVYEARLVNREAGEYKGYALAETDWPEGLSGLYG